MDEIITPLGKTNFRKRESVFGIKTDDRRRHIYVIGKTGSGKTTMMENMIIEDMIAGRGVGLIDPHGDFAEKILHFVPEDRIDDVIYFNPGDVNFPIGFNPLEKVGDEHRHIVASGLMGVFKKIWPDVWSARMEYILNNAILSLLEYPNSTILGVIRLLTDKDYRKEVVSGLEDPIIKNFWINEFSRYTQKLESEATASILNKIGQFVANPLIRNIIGQPHSTINIRKMMDEGKIFIANLSKGRIGEDNSALLGAILITKMQLAAMGRVNIPEKERKDFYLYVDEFQNFATESFSSILSEARKYRLDLVLAHQYIEQLDEKVRPAVFGNIGTIVVFRVGAEDAEFLEKEFSPEFLATDLVNLSKYSIYIKLMIDGIASKPFSAETLPPKSMVNSSPLDTIIENNRAKYGTPAEAVSRKISEDLQKGRQEVAEKSERREESSLDILVSPKKERKAPNLEELREALSKSISKDKQAEDQ